MVIEETESDMGYGHDVSANANAMLVSEEVIRDVSGRG